MPVYIVAQFRITDHGRFRHYDTAMRSILPRFGGEEIVSSNDLDIFAGQPNVNHVAVIRFPDEARAKTFTESPEYQMTSVLREAGAEMTAVLLRSHEVNHGSAQPTAPETLAPLFRPGEPAA